MRLPTGIGTAPAPSEGGAAKARRRTAGGKRQAGRRQKGAALPWKRLAKRSPLHARYFTRNGEIYHTQYSLFFKKYKIYALCPYSTFHFSKNTRYAPAENALREAMEVLGVPYVVNEGDGAFYGPKLDFHLEDSIGRTWQCGTIQLDMQMPQRFDITYVGSDNEKHRPIMIHRVIFGSIERFIGILTEHFAGKFPLWLAPV